MALQSQDCLIGCAQVEKHTHTKTPKDEDTQVFKFLSKLALLKSFQDWTKLCTTDLLGNLTT